MRKFWVVFFNIQNNVNEALFVTIDVAMILKNDSFTKKCRYI